MYASLRPMLGPEAQNLEHSLKQMQNKNNKIYKTVLVSSLAIFFLSLLVKFYLCGSMNIQNGKLQAIFTQKNELEKEISRLSYIDSTMSSLSYIEDKAKSLGFIEMKSRLLSLDPKSPVQVAAIQVEWENAAQLLYQKCKDSI